MLTTLLRISEYWMEKKQGILEEAEKETDSSDEHYVHHPAAFPETIQVNTPKQEEHYGCSPELMCKCFGEKHIRENTNF